MKSAIETLITKLHSIGQVSRSDREALFDLPITERVLPRDHTIVDEGDVSQACCLVVSGYVYRSGLTATGNRQIFSLHTSGDIPDLHSLHLPKMDHRLATLSESHIALIPHEAMRATLAKSQALTDLMWRDTLIDAAAFRAWMLMLGQADASSRMAHLICELYTRAGMAQLNTSDRFPLPLTQDDLADILGISLVHANRTLQDLRGQGLLEFDQQIVSVLRWEALRKLGQFDPAYLHYVDPEAGIANPATK